MGNPCCFYGALTKRKTIPDGYIPVLIVGQSLHRDVVLTGATVLAKKEGETEIMKMVLGTSIFCCAWFRVWWYQAAPERALLLCWVQTTLPSMSTLCKSDTGVSFLIFLLVLTYPKMNGGK